MPQRFSRRSSERPTPFPEQILSYPCNQQMKTPTSQRNERNHRDGPRDS
jgi:hypothetical protein